MQPHKHTVFIQTEQNWQCLNILQPHRSLSFGLHKYQSFLLQQLNFVYISPAETGRDSN